MRENYSSLLPQQLVDPVVGTVDINSASVDLDGFRSALLSVLIGESGDTLSGSVKIDLELEDSPDDSVWTNCALTDMVGGVLADNFGTIDAAAEDDAVFTVAYIGDQRYVRVVLNFTGTHTNGCPIAVVAYKGHAIKRPVS